MHKSYLASLLILSAAAGLPGAAMAETQPRAAAGAASAASAAGRSVAVTVNGVAISQAEVERMVRAEVARGAKDDAALRSRAREQLILRELLHQEALKRHLEQSPQYQAALHAAARDLLEMQLLQSVPVPAVSDADVRTVYERSTSNLAPNDVLLGAIVVQSESQVRQLWTQLARGAEFEALARANSLLPNGKSGGTIGWTNLRGDTTDASGLAVPPAIVPSARQLAKGGLSQPLNDGAGHWWILRVIDTRASHVAPFDQAAKPLRAELEGIARARAQKALADSLRKAAIIK